MRRLAIVLGLVALLAITTTGVALAAEQQRLGGKLVTGTDVVIPGGTPIDHDLYVFASTAIIDASVNGDVVVAAGSVTINGAVTGDVVAFGGQITINGPVTGDLRAAGGQIRVTGDVSEDVLAASGQVTVAGKVGQDLLVTAGQLTLSGSVAGSTFGSVGTYDKIGGVAGSDDITITPYRQPTAAPFTGGPQDPVFDAIRQFVAVMLFAILALWLAPRLFAAAEGRVRAEPLASFVWGIGSLVGYVVAIAAIVVVGVLLFVLFAALQFGGLMAVTVFGTFLSIVALTLGVVIAAVFLTDAIVGLALVRVVLGRRMAGAATAPLASMGQGRWADLGLIAVGAAAIVILSAIPALGGLVKFVVVLVGMGAIWLGWRMRMVTAGMPAMAPAAPMGSAPAAPTA